MLVLSRKVDESIMICDDVQVTVVSIQGDKVRLGVNAPREKSVHRKEVYDAIRRENRTSAPTEVDTMQAFAAACGKDFGVALEKYARDATFHGLVEHIVQSARLESFSIENWREALGMAEEIIAAEVRQVVRSAAADPKATIRVDPYVPGRGCRKVAK